MTKIKYIVYVRKSTEGEDRQVQSLDDQISILKKIAKEKGLKIVGIIEESKSAKEPYIRPKFEAMIDQIKKGKVDGVLTWEISRLSRNPIDSANIQWMLQRGVIKEIRTPQRVYQPGDNALIFSIEGAMSNQYILDLKRNVLRGMNSKRDKGIRPTLAPIGYLNENGTIVKDPDRFDMVRGMFEEMLTGQYSPARIVDMANNEKGLRTRSGKCMARATFYKTLSNLFYTGKFVSHEKEYEGIHPPMITMDEYDRIQMILGRRGNPRYQKREFPYTGTIRCGECGCLYTAQQNKKLLKSGKINKHIYYRCTRRKMDIDCSQRKHIKKADLETQIEKELENITILPQFRDWALKVITRENKKEVEDRTKIYNNLCTTIKRTQRQLDNLIDMRCRDLLNDEEYEARKGRYNKELENLRVKRDQTETRADVWIDLTESTFEFATNARDAFIKGNVKTKTEILRGLGQSFTMLDGELSIEINPWLKPIKQKYPKLEKEFKKLKPNKKGKNEFGNDDLDAICNKWSG